MDMNYEEEKVFSDVWQRISKGHTTESAYSQDDGAVLAELIKSEKENYLFYRSACRLGGSCASLFSSLTETSRKRLGRLQTFHFLIFGNNCTVNAGAFSSASIGTLSTLRQAYWRENKTASNLISAAMSISNGKFNSFGAEFARQAAKNAEHIIQVIDRIMK